MLKLILQAIVLMLVISLVPEQRLIQSDVINTTLAAVIGLLLLDFLYSKVVRPMRLKDPDNYA